MPFACFDHRRISTPDSPSPYPSFHRRATRAFPPLQDEGRGFVTALGLPVYIREHNTAVGSTTKLHIWAQNSRSGSGARALSNPAVVRVTLRDVVTVFVKMAYGDAERDALVVESVCAFGPREKVGLVLAYCGDLSDSVGICRKGRIHIRTTRSTRNYQSRWRG